MQHRRDLTFNEILDLAGQRSIDSLTFRRIANREQYGWVRLPTAALLIDGVVYATWNYEPFLPNTYWVECYPTETRYG